MTAATDTEVVTEPEQDIVPPCEHFAIYISGHDFKPTRLGEGCGSPAVWRAMVHSVRFHERRLAFMCDRHMREFVNAYCPNPVCCAPRMTDLRPL